MSTAKHSFPAHQALRLKSCTSGSTVSQALQPTKHVCWSIVDTGHRKVINGTVYLLKHHGLQVRCRVLTRLKRRLPTAKTIRTFRTRHKTDHDSGGERPLARKVGVWDTAHGPRPRRPAINMGSRKEIRQRVSLHLRADLCHLNKRQRWVAAYGNCK